MSATGSIDRNFEKHIAGRVLTNIQYLILRTIAPRKKTDDQAPYRRNTAIEEILGENFLETVRGKRVIDFGCGNGGDTIEVASKGAAFVTGVDIRRDVLETARAAAETAGVKNVSFAIAQPSLSAEIIISVDSFEHFGNPGAILDMMNAHLEPGGEIYISFGYPWYHPMGGHLFSEPFPWSHLLFSEAALIRWRSDFKTDGATRFGDVEGGLNQMTISRFEKLVEASCLRFKAFEIVPIRKLRWLHNRFTREFTTAVVRCRLVKKHDA